MPTSPDGVDELHESRALGRALLRDILAHTLEVGMSIGCRGLLAHCETEAASTPE